MKSKAQKDREYMKELGKCYAQGIAQGLSQSGNQMSQSVKSLGISIGESINLSPKEPFEFVGRIDGPPLTQYRSGMM